MKYYIIKLHCWLFGHKMLDDEFYSNNGLECCDRCNTCSHFAYETVLFSEREYYGVIGYPVFATKRLIIRAYYNVIDRFKRKPGFDDDECPF